MRAIHQKENVFWLLTSLIILHVLGLFVWQIVVQRQKGNCAEFTEEIADQVCKVECVSWLFIFLTTGLISLYEHVVIDIDDMVS